MLQEPHRKFKHVPNVVKSFKGFNSHCHQGECSKEGFCCVISLLSPYFSHAAEKFSFLSMFIFS